MEKCINKKAAAAILAAEIVAVAVCPCPISHERGSC